MPLPVVYLVAVPLFVLLAMVGTSIGYTRHIDGKRAAAVERVDREREAAEREADRRWCALLGLISRAAPTPTTDIQREYAALIAALRNELGCP